MTNVRRGRSYARLGWLGTTLALAVALVIGSWNSYRGARAAVSTLNRGQADLLDSALRELTPPWDLELRPDSLDAFLQRHEAAGLRYVALLDPNGGVTMSAGQPVAPPTPMRADSSTSGQRPILQVGDRMRAYFPRRPMPSERAAMRRDGEPRFDDAPPTTDSGRGDPGRDESGSRGGRGGGPQFSGTAPTPHQTLLEFEPLVATELVSNAARSLALAAIGASILTLAALLFWRKSGQYQRATLRLEEQKRLTVLGEMSAVLAHEIRNPLASLKGNAQLLAERARDDPRMKARVDRVVSEATRLEALTSDLLDFARSGPIEMQSADPGALLRTAVDDVAPDGFDVDIAGAPSTWTMDAVRIRQALVNVLQNARQASPEGKPPTVRAAQDAGRLVYEVRDYGPGLPADAAVRIFDPFFTTRTNGTGLGLAVARRVIEMHGGTITATNEPDGGARFRITLPANAN